MQVNWATLKQFVNSKSLSIQYIDLGDSYFLKICEGGFELDCLLAKDGGADVTDFETNFLANSNKNLWQSDTDGAQIVRVKAAKKGWTYGAIPIEFRTAEIGSLWSKTSDGIDRSGKPGKHG